MKLLAKLRAFFSADTLRIGDMVRVVNIDSIFYNKLGYVTAIADHSILPIQVGFVDRPDGLNETKISHCDFYPSELEKAK